MTGALLFGMLLLGSCAVSAHNEGPRQVVEEAAAAIEHADLRALDSHVTPQARRGSERSARLHDPEAAVAARLLRTAALGLVAHRAEVRLGGELGAAVLLEREQDGWRVDPDSFAQTAATPADAIVLLISALDRLPSDPALGMLSNTLRDSLLTATRERIRALRQIVPQVPTLSAGRLAVQIDYGNGLYIVLRMEHGSWRVDDFN